MSFIVREDCLRLIFCLAIRFLDLEMFRGAGGFNLLLLGPVCVEFELCLIVFLCIVVDFVS